MVKLDMRKQLPVLYDSSHEPAMIDVPPMNHLMVDDPETPTARRSTVRPRRRCSASLSSEVQSKSAGTDYGVLPLEGLWWVEDHSLLDLKKRDNWKWTSMIMQPGFVTENPVAEAMEEVRKRKNPPALPKVRFERFDEGLAAQIMHRGPFADEPLTIDRLDAYVLESGYGLRGRHHEIYLTT